MGKSQAGMLAVRLLLTAQIFTNILNWPYYSLKVTLRYWWSLDFAKFFSISKIWISVVERSDWPISREIQLFPDVSKRFCLLSSSFGPMHRMPNYGWSAFIPNWSSKVVISFIITANYKEAHSGSDQNSLSCTSLWSREITQMQCTCGCEVAFPHVDVIHTVYRCPE